MSVPLRSDMTAALASSAQELSDYNDLRDEDRELLALVAAHHDATEQELPWSLLNRYAADIAHGQARDLRLLALMEAPGLSKQLALLVNRLIDGGFVTPSGGGLALTNRAAALRGTWNGGFARLVAAASEVVKSY
jgi:hypothetical protein